MRFLLITIVLIGAGVGALFFLNGNDLLLIATFMIVILGFFLAVRSIATRK